MENGSDTAPQPRPPLPDTARRAPGWYPDDARDGFRHWDGRSWSSMRSSEPVWGPDAPGRDRPPAWRKPVVAAAVVAAAALVVGGAAALGGGGSTLRTSDAVATGTASDPTSAAGPGAAGPRAAADRGPADDEGDRGEGPGASGGDGGGTSAEGDPSGGTDRGTAGTGGRGSGPVGSGGDGGSGAEAPPGGGDRATGGDVAGGGGGRDGDAPGDDASEPPAVAGECAVRPEELTAVVRADPSLRAVSATMTVDDVVCSSGWASGIVTSRVTPRSLGVFEQRGGSWVLAGYGHRAPCERLGLPGALAAELRCRDF